MSRCSSAGGALPVRAARAQPREQLRSSQGVPDPQAGQRPCLGEAAQDHDVAEALLGQRFGFAGDRVGERLVDDEYSSGPAHRIERGSAVQHRRRVGRVAGAVHRHSERNIEPSGAAATVRNACHARSARHCGRYAVRQYHLADRVIVAVCHVQVPGIIHRHAVRLIEPCRAANAVRAAGSRAITYGPRIALAPGQWAPETATGPAVVLIRSAAGIISASAVEIVALAPGLFSADATGQGIAAAVALRVKADNTQSFEPVVRFDAVQQRFIPVPIDLGAETDQVFLVLFGSGLRNRSSLASVVTRVGGEFVPATFAGPLSSAVGVEQINLGPLPRKLAGRSLVDVVMIVDGKPANIVQVVLK